MGWVAIPEAPATPTFSVQAELDPSELQQTVHLLQAALQLARQRAEPHAFAPGCFTSEQNVSREQALPARVLPDSLQHSAYAHHDPAPAQVNSRTTARRETSYTPKVNWQQCFATSPEEHANRAVWSLLYAPEFKGLPGGDGHAGWLISGSNGLLNLWECSGSGGTGGEPSLQVMHSQVTNHQPSSMDLDTRSQLLLCAGGGDARCRVTLHSLDTETHFLAPKSTILLDEGTRGYHQPPQVVTLAPLGGPLKSHFAASFGSTIEVRDTAAAPASPPLAAWKAHVTDVTALHRNPYVIALYTGAADGSICMWDLQQKPTSPAATWRQPHKVASLQMVSEHGLMASSEEGHLILWDIRKGQTLRDAVARASVDNGYPLKKTSLSPLRDSIVVVTSKEILTLQLLADTQFGSTPNLVAKDRTFTDAIWNGATGEIMAATTDGRMAVFRDFQAS